MVCFADEKCDEIVRKKTWLGINKDTYMRTNSGELINGAMMWNMLEINIMAAIGIVQLKHLDRDNAYRRQIAEWYTEGFKDLGDKIKLVYVPKNCESSRHLFQIIVDKRDEMMLALNQQEIYPGVHYVDNTEYRMYQYAEGTCPNARYISDHVISLPMHLRLSYEDVQFVIKVVKEFVEMA